MKTEWKDSKEFLGIPGYLVSNTGIVKAKTRSIYDKRQRRVYIKKGAIIKPGIADGYLFVYFCHGGNKWKFFVHRLVALAFIGPPPEGKLTVDHIDRNRQNNTAPNLRWASHEEQTANKGDSGGQSGKSYILSEDDTIMLRALWEEIIPQTKGQFLVSASKLLGVSYLVIGRELNKIGFFK